MKVPQPARAGASSKASRSHQHIRRLASRRHFGGAEASTVSAAAAAAAAALPASEVKSSPTASVLGAATGRPLRSASPRSTVWSNACPAGRASHGGFARARETRTPSRRDAAPRARISCGLTGPPVRPSKIDGERRALSLAASRLAARRSPPSDCEERLSSCTRSASTNPRWADYVFLPRFLLPSWDFVFVGFVVLGERPGPPCSPSRSLRARPYLGVGTHPSVRGCPPPRWGARARTLRTVNRHRLSYKRISAFACSSTTPSTSSSRTGTVLSSWTM